MLGSPGTELCPAYADAEDATNATAHPPRRGYPAARPSHMPQVPAGPRRE